MKTFINANMPTTATVPLSVVFVAGASARIVNIPVADPPASHELIREQAKDARAFPKYHQP